VNAEKTLARGSSRPLRPIGLTNGGRASPLGRGRCASGSLAAASRKRGSPSMPHLCFSRHPWLGVAPASGSVIGVPTHFSSFNLHPSAFILPTGPPSCAAAFVASAWRGLRGPLGPGAPGFASLRHPASASRTPSRRRGHHSSRRPCRSLRWSFRPRWGWRRSLAVPTAFTPAPRPLRFGLPMRCTQTDTQTGGDWIPDSPKTSLVAAGLPAKIAVTSCHRQ
jgi:hypothetical protein